MFVLITFKLNQIIGTKKENIFILLIERPIMNKKLLLVVGAAIASSGLYSASAFAVDGNASATVLAPLTLTAGAGMDFGSVAGVTGATSTVVLTPVGGVSSGDGATIGGGSPAAGAFSVTGDDTLTYDISLPDTTTLTGGTGPDITVDTFTDSTGGTFASPGSSTTSGGIDNFTVGATLNLADGQGSGTYTGTYPVTIDYQ